MYDNNDIIIRNRNGEATSSSTLKGGGADTFNMFEAQVYHSRREALRRGLASSGETEGFVLFWGHHESPMNYTDNTYPFRQDSSFLYFFGVSVPSLAASIDLATGKTVLYGDDVSIEDIVWTRPVPAITELAARAGVADTAPRADVTKAASKASHILYLPPYRMDTRVELGELVGLPTSKVDAGASLPLILSVVALREVKQAVEIVEIEAAVAASVSMHKCVLGAARPGMCEAELMALATKAALKDGNALPFPMIATTRGAILHNHGYFHRLESGGLFLLDAGAGSATGYSGDLSTTFPISPRFSPRQRAIYDIVLAAQKKAISLLKPGTPFLRVHLAAARVIVEGLSALGLMRGDAEEAVLKGAHALFFPCGLGHQMGLDVHDMESYGEVWVGYNGTPKSTQFGLAALRLAKPLRPGMTLTVEPGIYFIPELIARWKAERRLEQFIIYDRLDAYLDFGGARNEEDWTITEDGARRLGPEFDKSPETIEAMREWG